VAFPALLDAPAGGVGGPETSTPVTVARAAPDAGASDGLAITSPPRPAFRTVFIALVPPSSGAVGSGLTPIGDELAAE
jgi:hypothetical protein